MILISHDLTAVEQLCGTVLLLDRGEAVGLGDPDEIVGLYHRRVAANKRETSAAFQSAAGIEVTNLTLLRAESGRLTFERGEPLTVTVRLAIERSTLPVSTEVTFYATDRQAAMATLHSGSDTTLCVEPPGEVIEFSCPALPLPPGTYYVGAVVQNAMTDEALAWWDGGTMLHVVAPRGGRRWQMPVPHSWRFLPDDDRIETSPAGSRR
jgi:hypothetical protein